MSEHPADAEGALRAAMSAALGLSTGIPVTITGEATLVSAYPVSDLATASVATAGAAAAELLTALGLTASGATASGATDAAAPVVEVDRGLADAWFGVALTPVGWALPSPWDPIAGDYRALDGWIRLHTNAPHHRAAALRVLGVDSERDHVAAAVATWVASELEDAVVAEGGCAAVLRTPAQWAAHPQGIAVAAEPLIAMEPLIAAEPMIAVEPMIAAEPMIAGAPGAADGTPASARGWAASLARPLAGLRVLDLTRVLAGPVATRMLAGLGADVLRVDPPGWDEPGVVPDMTLGKRTARLDARDPAGRETLLELLAGADVLVHGYRSDALDRLGLGDAVRAAVRPGLVDVALDAYGWSGPWRTRRGFDSLVQMSTGIAGWGIAHGTAERPTPLPVQALDHATGYLMAAAVLASLTRRVRTGAGSTSRLSLARTALELERARALPARPAAGRTAAPGPASAPLDTPWGAATLLPSPIRIGGIPLSWDHGPRELGSDAPAW